MLKKGGFTTENLNDNTCYTNFCGNSKNFTQAVEFNIQTNYLPLVQRKVSLDRYNGQYLDIANQPQPDMVADFSKSDFTERRIHGIDQKSGKAHMGLSTIFSKMEEKIYLKKLKNFQAQLYYHTDKTELNDLALTEAFNQLHVHTHTQTPSMTRG